MSSTAAWLTCAGIVLSTLHELDLSLFDSIVVGTVKAQVPEGPYLYHELARQLHAVSLLVTDECCALVGGAVEYQQPLDSYQWLDIDVSLPTR